MKLLPLIIFTIVLFAANNVLAISDSANVQLQITAECNNNGVCQENLDESESNCSSDCGCNNNGRCESERVEHQQNCPNDCQTAISGPGDPSFYIENIVISKITFHSADILWQTTRPTQCSLSWGETSEYEKEIISETDFKPDHSVSLNNLRVSGAYHFKINCKDRLNFKNDSGDWYFSALDLVPNVSWLRAIAGSEKITLTWLNPEYADFKGVRIVRNSNFYPRYIEDGIIIYEGAGVSFTDQKLQNKKTYYYTVFSFDKQQNYSSGAIVSAVPREIIAPTPPPQPPPEPSGEEIVKLNFNDFDFYWEKGKISLKNEKTVEIEKGKLLIVSIDYKKLPEVCKTIIAELEKGKEYFSYIFETDKEKNAYNAAFFAPEEQDFYPLIINCLDNSNKIASQAKGEIEVYKKPEAALLYKLFSLIIFINLILIIFLIILLLLLLLLLAKRKKEDSEKQKISNYSN